MIGLTERFQRAAQMMDEDDDDDEGQGEPRQRSTFLDADDEVEGDAPYIEGSSYDESSEAEVAPTVNGVHEDKH